MTCPARRTARWANHAGGHGGGGAYLYFFTLVLLGVFMVMNIFLAILLSNFENSEDLVAAPGPEGAQKNSIVSKSIKRASMAVVNSIRKKPASAALKAAYSVSYSSSGAQTERHAASSFRPSCEECCCIMWPVIERASWARAASGRGDRPLREFHRHGGRPHA